MINRAGMNLSAIIVDDELHGRENLALLLNNYCPEISLIGVAKSAEEARQLIHIHQPQVVFLDIQMPQEDGFALLESIGERNFSVVFVTAYDAYGIKAVKASAADYILKPVSVREVQQAVGKLMSLHGQKDEIPGLEESYRASVDALIKDLSSHSQPQTLTLPMANGFRMVPIKSILRIEADDNYTHVYVFQDKAVMVAKTLKHFEGILDNSNFCRIHRSHIINIEYIKSFSRKDGGIVELMDQTVLPISRRRMPEFLRLVQAS
ncbi:MAG: LytTR family DNA-binding domain-containing protein [Bacteroidota bacterium]